MIEFTSVDYQGMISPNDLRLDSKKHSEKLNPLLKIIESYGGLSGIQLRHAEGRLATTHQQKVGENTCRQGRLEIHNTFIYSV